MPTIEVLQPFGLRLDSSTPRRDFGHGVHEVSDAELDHWFMQACLKDKRAVLVEDKEATEADQSGKPIATLITDPTVIQETLNDLQDTLGKMTNSDLVELMQERGVDVPKKYTKAELVALIVADAEKGLLD